MESADHQWSEWRNKIIGLGEQSTRKNYYPELQKRLEELKASESDLRMLFDSVSDAIFIHDEHCRVVDVNEAMLSMYRVTREEAVCFSIEDYSADRAQIERLPQVFAELHASKKMLFEWKARRPKDGSQFDVEVSLRATQWKNQEMVVAVVRDISERKQAEQKRHELELQLAQAQKIESIGRLAGGIAHDFNNMLQAILGNAALALRELPDNHPLREHLEEILSSAERSADLTRQLLTFARKQTICPKVLDLNATIAGLLKMLRRLIGEDINLEYLPGEVWPIKIDPSQLDQILANLAVNARDAISGTGVLKIETGRVTFDKSDALTQADFTPGDYVVLEVTDNGSGMSSETKSHLFEPFFTTKPQGKGTGLGLATVFGIIKQNHAHITFQSEQGKGTTFKIYFPRCEEAAAPVAPKNQIQFKIGNETVLLVEDETQVLNLARRILQQYGYHVLTADNPVTAVEIAARCQEPIHLLITDIIMPGMNGKELHQRLRSMIPDIKCLYMSGYTYDAISRQGVLNDGISFLQKPFTIQTITDKVREALNEARPAEKKHSNP